MKNIESRILIIMGIILIGIKAYLIYDTIQLKKERNRLIEERNRIVKQNTQRQAKLKNFI